MAHRLGSRGKVVMLVCRSVPPIRLGIGVFVNMSGILIAGKKTIMTRMTT